MNSEGEVCQHFDLPFLGGKILLSEEGEFKVPQQGGASIECNGSTNLMYNAMQYSDGGEALN